MSDQGSEKKKGIGRLGPMCCGEPSHRVRFFSSIEAFDKAERDAVIDPEAKEAFSHVGYECRRCGKIRTAETEEDAALLFKRA